MASLIFLLTLVIRYVDISHIPIDISIGYVDISHIPMVNTGRPEADWEWGVRGGGAPPTSYNIIIFMCFYECYSSSI